MEAREGTQPLRWVEKGGGGDGEGREELQDGEVVPRLGQLVSAEAEDHDGGAGL